MRPNTFDYSKPETIKQTLKLIRDGATVLAGGQSLIQGLRLRTLQPALIVDINHVAELSNEIHYTPNIVVVGALVTHRTFCDHPLINTEFPWLAKAARELGDVQVRNRGTVLGNVCWADPRANMAVALLASNAFITTADVSRGQSQIPIEEFFSGFRRNVLGKRLATSVTLARNMEGIGSYIEFSRQRQDLALCNVCVVHNARGTAISIGGIDQRPRRVPELENILNDPDIATEDISTQFDAALQSLKLSPLSDHFGTPAYKLDLASTLVKRAIDKCLSGGDGGR